MSKTLGLKLTCFPSEPPPNPPKKSLKILLALLAGILIVFNPSMRSAFEIVYVRFPRRVQLDESSRASICISPLSSVISPTSI